MNPEIRNAQQYQMVNTLQLALESANNAASIVSKTLEETLQLQLQAGAAGLSETLPQLVPKFSPEGSANMLWNLPALYQTQTQRMVQTMLDTFAPVSRGQHEMLEWACQALSNSVKQFADVMYRLNGAVASRRVSAEVINFSDRRTALQLSDNPHGHSAASESAKGAHRSAKQANG